jgi:broad specificity phosphatase PhoE
LTQPLTRVPFWYLRHGQTDWNAKDLSQGNVDIPLNATGIQQAHDAAAKLRNRGIAEIYVSPLSRAVDTARIVADALGLGYSIIHNLREVSFGVQEGREMGDWFHAWVREEFTPEGAESFVSLRARALGAVNEALLGAPPVLVVGHGALFRALRAEMGLDRDVRMKNAQPVFCVPDQAGWELRET